MLKTVYPLLGSIAIIYVLVCAVLYVIQVRLLFPGEPLPSDFAFREMDGVEEVLIPIDKGNLSALHFKNPTPQGLIFFLHGNAGNLDSWVPDVDFYRAEAFDLFMIDYRGYGKSNGHIQSQKQLIDDVLQSWNQVSPEYIDANIPIMIYGRSIGTFLAAELSTKVEHDALVLVSPYSSLKTLVKEKLRWLPSSILRFPLNTQSLIEEKLIKYPAKTTLIHGAQDLTIPIEHAHRLASINDEISLVEVDAAAHNDIHDFSLYKSTMSKIARSMHR